jgi:hypothetical protein
MSSEHESEASRPADPRPSPAAEFLTLVASLAGQATIHLGMVEHPIAKKVEKDLKQARFAIDLLAMLERKTRGNLTPDEQDVLGRVLSDLRMRFVQVSK